jgi:hypothetical protein
MRPPALPEHPLENLTREISSTSRQKRIMRWSVAMISEAINERSVSSNKDQDAVTCLILR